MKGPLKSDSILHNVTKDDIQQKNCCLVNSHILRQALHDGSGHHLDHLRNYWRCAASLFVAHPTFTAFIVQVFVFKQTLELNSFNCCKSRSDCHAWEIRSTHQIFTVMVKNALSSYQRNVPSFHQRLSKLRKSSPTSLTTWTSTAQDCSTLSLTIFLKVQGGDALNMKNIFDGYIYFWMDISSKLE